MAILKNIPIHASGNSAGKAAGMSKAVNNVVDYIDDPEKNIVLKKQDDIDRVLKYDINDEKTMLDQKGVEKSLVSYVGTSKSTITDDFQDRMDKYHETHTPYNYKTNDEGKQKKEIIAFHFVQSFKESGDEVDPEKIHEMGKEWLSQMGYIGVVSTHMDTDNIHNHILVCPYPESDEGKKLVMNRKTWREACQLNDEICKDYGMPTLEQQKMEQGRHKEGERDGTAVHNEKKARKAGNSYKEQLRRDIDASIPKCKTWDDFKAEMEKSEWIINESSTGKTVTAIEMSNDKHRCRLDRLGEEYSKDQIIQRMKEQEKANEHSENERSERERETAQQNEEQNKKTSSEKDLAETLVEDTNKRNLELLNKDYYIKPRKKKNYHVSNYTANGQRRSEIVVLMLELLALLKRIRDAIVNSLLEGVREGVELEAEKNRRLTIVEKRIQDLEKQIKTMEKYNANTKDDLKTAKRDAGKNLNNAKAELASMKQKDAYTSHMKELLTQYARYEHLKQYIPDDMLLKYTKAEIQKEIADLYPATKEQRSDLYKLLVKDEKCQYRVEGKWDTLNAEEAGSIIDFLKGKTTDKPERLVGKYEKGKKEDPQKESNDKKMEAWEKHLETLPEDVRKDVDRLHGIITDMNKIGIDLERHNLQTLQQQVQKIKTDMRKKVKDVERCKEEYMNIIRIEKAIENAEQTVESEKTFEQERTNERAYRDTDKDGIVDEYDRDKDNPYWETERREREEHDQDRGHDRKHRAKDDLER